MGVASSPGHSQILSRSSGEKQVSLRLQDKIWEWPGNEASMRDEKEEEEGGGAEIESTALLDKNNNNNNNKVTATHIVQNDIPLLSANMS